MQQVTLVIRGHAKREELIRESEGELYIDLETCSIASMKKTNFISLGELILKSSRYSSNHCNISILFSIKPYML